VKRIAPYAIVAAGWGFVVAYAHPGLMSFDSCYQLAQARSGEWGNWHPPVMAALWSVLDRIVAGPLLLLLVQTSLFTVGLYALARRYWSARPAAIVTSAMLVFPPVFVVLAGVWKDSLMAGLLLCGAAGLLSARRPARLGGWLALALASALRHNAAVLVVPLVIMIAPLPAAWPLWRRRVIGAGLGIALAVSGALATRVLMRVDDHPFANMLALSDLAGTIARAPDLPDTEARELLVGTPLRTSDDIQLRLRKLDIEAHGWEAVALGEDRMFDRAKTDAEADAIVAAWRRVIGRYPGAYLAHRASMFSLAIGWRGSNPTFVIPIHATSDPVPLCEPQAYDGFQRAIGRALRVIHHWPLFSPLLYLVLAAGLLVVRWSDPLQRGLLAGALAYTVSLFLLSPGGHDFRYIHWLIVVSTFGSIVHMGSAKPAPRIGAGPRPGSDDVAMSAGDRGVA
jgi:hypothetical protein